MACYYGCVSSLISFTRLFIKAHLVYFMKFKQWLLPVLIIVFAYGLGQLLIALKASPIKRPPVNYSAGVEVMSVQLGELTLLVDSQGNVQPKQRLDLVSEVTGTVLWMTGELVEGGLVKQGQVLLHIDPINYQVALAEAKASLAQANLNLKDEQAEYKRGTAFRSTTSNAGVRQHKLAQVEAEYDSALQRVKKAEQDLAKTRIKAPFDAVIHEKSVEVGQYVSSGNRLFNLLGTKTAEVRLPITASEITYIRPDNNASKLVDLAVTLSASFGALKHYWPAKLVRLENRVDEATRVFYAVAEVENPYELNIEGFPLSVGMFVEARIEGNKVPQAVRVPNSALHDNSEVFLVVDGRIERRKVTVLRREKQTAVITGGLSNGDQIILTRLDLMVDGMFVSVINANTEQPEVKALKVNKPSTTSDRSGVEAGL